MMIIPDMPEIRMPDVYKAEHGYHAVVLCKVDGYPAELVLRVDTYKQEYSEYYVSVWNPNRMHFNNRVVTWSGEKVGRMPILAHDEDTLTILNVLARQLWDVANAVMVTGRERQDEIDSEIIYRNERREAEEIGVDAEVDRGVKMPPPATLEEWEQELLEESADEDR